jgi:two-component system, OmpR family, alkaline phosphatase synthesis response regulator PhoP
MTKKILIAEDDHDLVKLLKYNLEKEGFKTAHTSDGSLVLAEIRRDEPDLVILDLMMPGIDGLEICRQIRRHEKYASLSVLMLTARSEEADCVVGLEIGADDYVTKPFSMRELIARVRTVLRRHDSPVPLKATLQRGNLVIDPTAHSVSVEGRRIDFSALEFRLLHYLGSHPGMVFSRDQLLDRVWGDDRSVTPRSVDVYVRRVREKIEPQPQSPTYIQTVHGVGYRFANGMD